MQVAINASKMILELVASRELGRLRASLHCRVREFRGKRAGRLSGWPWDMDKQVNEPAEAVL
jgi:hypothetical protein